ncbi:hypothetical protein IPZ58_05200 [Streptomyces roseoverticillatus]|uniref:hypothetical protein n=1 Tax=Streptomyces roseoverticillatus TaxID=66429 RepID=UPI001F46ADE4|nr:hypothetical protein [Streptomyces roseoverticillatus]MCF3100971.1 hypothetical protein [Streptomyces roseoverticillatus]
MALDYHPVLVWTDKGWVETEKKVWNGSAWVSRPSVRYWDGQEWTPRPPAPQEFATYVGSNSGSSSNKRYAALPVPPGTRVNDFVVSICASMSGLPRLLSPAGQMPQVLGSNQDEISLAVACWPYTGAEDQVLWDLGASPQAKLVNLVYRNGDVAQQSITPVSDMQVYKFVDQVPLMASKDFTGVFVALTVSRQVTSYRWPEGLVPRESALGRFGSYEISVLTADTPGAGASAGTLGLNTAVDAASLYLVTIPGRSDGRPTWILGDDVASVLGVSTYLG